MVVYLCHNSLAFMLCYLWALVMFSTTFTKCLRSVNWYQVMFLQLWARAQDGVVFPSSVPERWSCAGLPRYHQTWPVFPMWTDAGKGTLIIYYKDSWLQDIYVLCSLYGAQNVLLNKLLWKLGLDFFYYMLENCYARFMADRVGRIETK